MPLATSVVLNAVLPPAVVYVLFVAGMVATYRRPRRPRGPRTPAAPRDESLPEPDSAATPAREASPRRLLRYLVATALGGYVCFLLLDVFFFFALGGQPASFLRQAVTGGAWLGFGVGVPILFVLGWLEWRTSRRTRASP